MNFDLNDSDLSYHKQQIKQQFGKAAERYGKLAQLQRRCANKLLNELDFVQPKLPQGNAIEIGCGTGFLTQGLVERMGDRPLEITDLSEAMLTVCQRQIYAPKSCSNLTFQSLDGELWQPSSKDYALIISSFAVQWFQQLGQALNRWIAALKPGGMILISFPTCHSFSEWKAACQELDLPFTANPLPDPEAIAHHLSSASVYVSYWQESIEVRFASPLDFFRELKQIGAGTNLSQKQLSISEFRKLKKALNDSTSSSTLIHYDVAYFTIIRQ
ncbi:MAG: hypothetical protein Fur0046_07180 [Cyanobacteria bacterium J069]|nr:MAG: methyltransferase domain-containing protein [Cyanobacteria bacterium J069]